MGKSWVVVLAIFLFVLASRLYFAFQTPLYSSDDAYLHLRYVETILQGKLLWHDPLGYGGRTLMMSPIFDAILALFGLIIPLPLALKIIPNIFASLLVIPAFLIAQALTNSKTISAFAAIIASFVPAYFAHTFNHASPMTLAIPLFFCLTYLWIKVPNKIVSFLLLLILFVFFHPLSIIFILSIATYLALTTIEHTKPKLAEFELGLFSIFFALWAQFLLYKKLILFHGPAVIWQNTPKELLSAFYANITVLGAIAQIGVFPLVDGTYALYKTAFKEPQKETLMLLSITIISTLMLWLKLIDLQTGFTLLGVTLALAFAKSLLILKQFIQQTKITKYAWVFIMATAIAALATTAYPAYTQANTQITNTISQEEVNALNWLDKTAPEQAVVIAPVNYGNYITALAKRKNIMDDYFFLQPRINERYEDLTRLYKTSFETEAVELFDKYSATYLLVPPGTKDIKYANGECFKRVKATTILIYEKNPECKIKVVA